MTMEDYTEVFVWGSAGQGRLGQVDSPAVLSPVCCGFGQVLRLVACGDEFTLLVSEAGQLLALGSNDEGRLGVGDPNVKEICMPMLVKELSSQRIVGLSCGIGHSVAVTAEGLAFAWGRGDSGVLGTGSTETQWSPQPMKVPASMRVRQASCGARHTALLAITSDSKGCLLTCGAGESGQLGNGLRSVAVPSSVQTEGEVKQVSCGVVHTAFTTYLGRAYAMGGNSLGQLGCGSKTGAKFPVRVRSLEGVFMEKVACGNHTAGLSDKGELYLWGTGPFGERLLPWKVPLPTPLRDLEVGGCFGAAVDVAKRVWTWGTNSSGELGHGDFKQRRTPTLIPSLSKRLIKTLSCGTNFVVALGQDIHKSRDQSPFAKYNLPRSRPFSELQTPRNALAGVESPLSTKVTGTRSPSEYVFSPRKDQETIPETNELEQSEETRPRSMNLRLDRITSDASAFIKRPPDRPHPVDIDDSEKVKIRVMKLEQELTTAKESVSFLEREIEGERLGRREAQERLEEIQGKFGREIQGLEQRLTEKEEELSRAIHAKQQAQSSLEEVTSAYQQLQRELQEERVSKANLQALLHSIEQENHRLRSVPEPGPSDNGHKPALPQLNLAILAKAQSRKDRTIRLLSSITPSNPRSMDSSDMREEELNMRSEELDESPRPTRPKGHVREPSQGKGVSHSAGSLSEAVLQDYPRPTEVFLTNSPTTVATERGENRPRLRNNVSDLKDRLKALKANQPALESKITAFERRLRGTMERK